MSSPAPLFASLRRRIQAHPGAVALLAAAAGVALARPRDRGAPHPPPFDAWSRELRERGPGKPVLLLDLDALDRNLATVRKGVAEGLAIRVVAKSLPSIPLLRYVQRALGTNRLMVFDDSLSLLARELPDADLLLGKPLPVQAAAAFYAERRDGEADPGARVAWLVDSPARLAQYEALAGSLGVRMRIVIEVDVGLHRGGVSGPDELAPMLRATSASAGRLCFAGLMGYDAHVAAAPPLVSSPARELSAVIERYRAFLGAVTAHAPGWLDSPVILNGGGSKTYSLYTSSAPVNEVAVGSALVMPTDFDVPTLSSHVPAVFIATPVLKRLSGPKVPYLEWAERPWRLWNPNRELTYFVFGGGWMARPVSPPGLTQNPVYGHSTNQAILNGSERTGLEPDDQVFFRPTQSERVMQELGAIRLARGGLLSDTWSVIPF